MGDRLARFRFSTGNGAGGSVAYRADCYNRKVVTIFQFPAFSYRDFFQRTFPVNHYPASSRITDHKRTFIRQLCCVHQSAQFMFIHWGGDGQVGYRTQISHIESSVMSRTVFADKSGTVETQYNGKILYGYIMNHIIIRPLHKRGIDIAEWQHPVFSHSSGEGNGVSFGDTDIERAFGHFLHKNIHRTTAGHGGGHTDNLWISFCKLH